MTEFGEAKLLANRVLDRPNADPDDDLAMLARQFLRQTQKASGLLADKALLGMYQEAIKRLWFCLHGRFEATPDRGISDATRLVRMRLVLDRLAAFDFARSNDWQGWPEGTDWRTGDEQESGT